MYDPPAYLWAITIAGPVAVAALTCIVLYRGAERSGLGRKRSALLAGAAAVVLGGWLAASAVIAGHGWYRTLPWFPVAVTGYLGLLLALRRIPVVARALAAPGMASRLELPHAPRVAGVAFLLYLALGHLPPLFALPAGLGDIAAGIAAPLVARRLAQGTGRRAALWFNAFGMTDLVVALTLGALTGFALLNVSPSSAPISELPLALIPTATVPLFSPCTSRPCPRWSALHRRHCPPPARSLPRQNRRYGVKQAVTGPDRSELIVSVRGLVKRYASREAVAGIDVEVRRGEIFAFLGPNGAGKSTTIEILEGFRQRTQGQVSVLGHDPATAGAAWRDRVGVVLQESEPEPSLSVRECLAMYAGFYRAPRNIDDTLALVGLTGKAGALGTRLSGGQRRRLDFALALIGDPELIFLDEPTTGFDPSARRAAWEVVAGLRQLGKTVILTTHYMEEAEYLADRITVLSGGHIVAEGTPQTLGGRDHMTTAISFTLPHYVQAHDLPPGLSPLTKPGPGGSTVMHSESPLVHLQMLGNWALGRGFDLPDLDVHRPTLEEVYLSLTGPASKKDQR